MRLGLTLAACVSVSALAQAGGTIDLSTGSQKVMNIVGIERISIGDASIADVKTIGTNQVLITGRHEGKTTLMVWKASGQQQTWTIAVSKGQKLHLEETYR